MLICVGVLALAAGSVAVAIHRGRAALALELGRGSLRRIADVRNEGRVRVEGMVVAHEDGAVLTAPCSGEPAVWFRVRVLRRVRGYGAGGSSGSSWPVVIDEQNATAFDIVDQSAGRALVLADDADVLAEAKLFEPPPEAAEAVPALIKPSFRDTLTSEAHDRLGRFLSSRGHDLWFGDLYEEQCLRPGDAVSAVGRGRREAGPPLETAYRRAPSTALVLAAAPKQRLVIAQPAVALRERYGAYLAGKLAMVAGLASIVAGLIVRAVVGP